MLASWGMIAGMDEQPDDGLTDTTFDIEQPDVLARYLRQRELVAAHEDVRCIVLAGGVSNRTVLVQRSGGDDWVVKQALAQLRTAVEWFSDPARIHREALGLRWLERLTPAGTITPLVFEDHANHLLGMVAVPQPHQNWKTVLLDGGVRLDHCADWGGLLGAIHAHAYAQRDAIAPVFADRDFFETLRVEPYYRYAATQVPAAQPFIARLIDDTYANPITLVHGDYSPKNVLVYDDRLVLLDHEVIHWGDPAFDLGFSLTHLLSKAHHLAAQRDLFASAARHYWDAYRTTTAQVAAFDAVEERAVRHTLACLLARVRGRSTLEYLDVDARARQERAVLALMQHPPTTVPDLIATFIARIA